MTIGSPPPSSPDPDVSAGASSYGYDMRLADDGFRGLYLAEDQVDRLLTREGTSVDVAATVAWLVSGRTAHRRSSPAPAARPRRALVQSFPRRPRPCK